MAGFLVFGQVQAETALGQRRIGVVLAPELVRLVELRGAGLSLAEEVEIPLRVQKLHHVIPVGHGGLHIRFCLFAQCELVILPDQALQAAEAPEEDALRICGELLREIRIVLAVRVFFLRREDDLPAKEALAAIIEGFQRSVAEAEEADIDITLITLLALLFQIQGKLCCDNELEVIGIRQGLHLHVVVHHD